MNISMIYEEDLDFIKPKLLKEYVWLKNTNNILFVKLRVNFHIDKFHP